MNEDIEVSELSAEQLAEQLRSSEPISPKYKERWLKLLKIDLVFLKEFAPNSPVLQKDFTDIFPELKLA